MHPPSPVRPRTKCNVPRYPRLAVGIVLGVAATAGCGRPAQTAGVPPQSHEEAKPPPDTTAPEPDPNAPQPQPEPQDPSGVEQPPGAAPVPFDET